MASTICHGRCWLSSQQLRYSAVSCISTVPALAGWLLKYRICVFRCICQSRKKCAPTGVQNRKLDASRTLKIVCLPVYYPTTVRTVLQSEVMAGCRELLNSTHHQNVSGIHKLTWLHFKSTETKPGHMTEELSAK